MKTHLKHHQKKAPLLRFGEFSIPILIFLLCVFSLLAIGASIKKPITGHETLVQKVILFFQVDYVSLQFLWMVMGGIVLLLVGMFNYELYGKFSAWIYWGSIVMLVFVLLVGSKTNGTTGWIKVPFLQNLLGDRTIQPSELAKIALALWLAREISKHENGIRTVREFLPILGYFLLPFFLILLQPDYGTGIVYLVMFITLLLVGGINWKLFLGVFSMAAAAVPLAWFFLFGEVQRNRIYTFLNPLSNPDAAYQVTKAKTAIGSGGFFGKGIFDTSSMAQSGFLPEKHTDMIFGVVGEAFGFLGVLILLALLFTLVLRILSIALSTRDRFGSLVTVGVLAMFVAHIFENIGMCMGLMPITGIPLPFVSYGGSAMIANMLAAGIVVSVSWRRPKFEGHRRFEDTLFRLNTRREDRHLPTMEF